MAKKNGSSGRFVWHELSTSDPKRAIAFYGELFGWKARDVKMGASGEYTLLSNGTTDVAGITELSKGQSAPMWLGYTTTSDADATAEKAKNLGAKVVVPPTDIPNIGRFTILVDPQGAVIAPMKVTEEAPEVEGNPALGTFCWDELVTNDPKGSVSFHTALFGLTANAMDMGPAGTYHVLHEGERRRAGVLKAPKPGIATQWLAYVVVDDVDASAQRAVKLGGKVMGEPADIPNIGRYAVITDPSGAAIALFKGDM